MFKSKFFIFTLLVCTSLSIFIFYKRDVIFQEGNPIPFALAMSKMVIQDKEMVEVEPIDNQYPYLVKRGKMEPFIDMMEQDGWTFVDRDIMANSLIFEKGDQSKSVPYKYFTRYYTLIYSY
ncbi:hypothetical protein CN445_02050 [Bacillus cereus]|uniref:Uncharacterized protein n=2 Tax=Bacillus cereus group TaxID=86661 RepID=A0A2B0GFJ6_BACCE|nr:MULTISPECIES: hypothetical protein [Bacillus cereus group]EJS55376.1 hypothetical protein ICG_03638 [Bacillus cereus BAG1X1-3]EOO78991.1 hypothetical protein IC7_01123 [Bacillus cereus BAG1O-1]EOP56149.1 hypothetical protein IKQ_01366 [Bacillus cereus VDM053]MDR4168930.1 hypothetical protein [Bacillus nitratireducens]MED0902038.1 hypothetical protein [Bacillus nitratireducens]